MSSTASPSKAEGSCLCGAVSFSCRMPARWVAHCHCTRCQRAHGAAFVTWVGTMESDVDITDPRSALTWYTHTEASRGFCRECGSPLFFKSPRYPRELHIARAQFQGDFAQEPQANAFTSTRAAWGVHAEDLPAEPEPVWSR